MNKTTLALFLLCVATPFAFAEDKLKIAGPLTDDGRIDYFRALEKHIYPPELATDDNGFRLFIRQFGDANLEYGGWTKEASPEEREFYRRQIYEKLNLDPTIPPTLKLPREPHDIVVDFYKAKGEDSYDLNAPSSPWTLEQLPMLADWLKEADAPLDAIAEAIRKPVFFAPLLSNPESPIVSEPMDIMDDITPYDHQVFRRNIARHFQARVAFRIGKGDIDGAIDDTLTIYRLARLTAQKGTMYHYIAGIAIETMALSSPLNANPKHPLTEKQIRRILDGLAALPPFPLWRDVVEVERYMILSTMQEIAFARQRKTAVPKRLTENEGVWLASELSQQIDWNVVNVRVNEVYDALKEPPPREKFHALLDAIVKSKSTWSKINRTFLTRDGIAMAVADLCISISTPVVSVDAFEKTVHRAESMRNMQRLVLAMLQYRLEQGKLPNANWTKQIEKYLGENPEQYFSCPSNPSPKGETMYALVQYGNTVSGSHDLILLIELNAPVPVEKAVVRVEEVLKFALDTKGLTPHPGGRMTARQSGAVMFIPSGMGEHQLLPLLGR
jgi:hypothetical protein